MQPILALVNQLPSAFAKKTAFKKITQGIEIEPLSDAIDEVISSLLPSMGRMLKDVNEEEE